ncbi:MAG: lysylphosphatidylglycerol synthase transmembrane domain-containing protein [Candidatus Omnitrophica bacterium]|nr:lysylphosphatidylglycerol synthase transmembrane domain-containing protein [Candidatus Omnitrophota bacterium]MDD5352122.1 lysylphosphatidylglycerol synthase transmembrane domain-containing protein [Candidatus Omnitrophota bacterium]MDD5549720.1 lysylphosphatidylglycerol synthase transmembrane domain-containing protein [Candidatus Omnitrophota bacterium]
MKSFLSFILKISISIALLIFLFNRIDIRHTVFYIRAVEPLYFICAVLLFLFVIYLGIARWEILLKALKHDLTFGRIFISYCGGLFFNVFLPSSIGGDIVRTTDLALHTKDSSSIFATVFLDRVLGFVGLVLVAISGFLIGHICGLDYDFRLSLFIIIFTAILICIFAILFSKRIFNLVNKLLIFKTLKNYLAKFHDCCHSFRFQKTILVKTIFLSVILQASYAAVFYLVGLSLGIKLNIIHYLIFVPIIGSVTILPISIGGLGLRDNAAVVLFSTLGVAADRVVAMTLINFAFLFFIGVLGGIIYAIALYSRRL